MKRTLAFLLALVMALSLCACSGTEAPAETTPARSEPTAAVETEPVETEPVETEPELPKVNLGDTISTDIWDFTLNDAVLSIYASSTTDGTYAKPVDKESGIYVASVGRNLTCLSFVVKNKDRGHLSIGDGGSGDWSLRTLSIVNGEDEYPIKGFDLNNKDGFGGLSMDCGTINGQKYGSHNYIMDGGQTIIVQIVGIVGVEAENLPDTFYLKVGVPNSSGETEYFEYEITK